MRKLYNTELFVIDGAKLDATKIRNTFAKLFGDYACVQITFADYCHVAKYFALKMQQNTA